MRRGLLRLLVLDHIIEGIAQLQRLILQEGISQKQDGSLRLTKRQTCPHSIFQVRYSSHIERRLREICLCQSHELETNVEAEVIIITAGEVHVCLQGAALSNVEVEV